MFLCLIILIVSVAYSFAATVDTIDRCVLPSGIIGFCVTAGFCPEAVAQIRRYQYYTDSPPVCGFKGFQPIYCCENPSFESPDNTDGLKNDKSVKKNLSVANYRIDNNPNLDNKKFNRISDKKCYEYYKEFQRKEYNQNGPTAQVDESSKASDDDIVGNLTIIRNEYGKYEIIITEVIDALPKEFLHMASVGYGEENDIHWGACGGSLISEKFILTAAHCLFSRSLGEPTFIRLGDLDLNTTDDEVDTQDFRIVRKYLHPRYNHKSHYHDIALLELNRPARITQFVRPACLYTSQSIHADETLIATGWGMVRYLGGSSNHLRKIDLYPYDYEHCYKYYNRTDKKLRYGIVDKVQICAGAVGRDTCGGDSGGPLQMVNKEYRKGHQIAGITSFGRPCSASGAPGIYTRVAPYVKWIEGIVWPNQTV